MTDTPAWALALSGAICFLLFSFLTACLAAYITNEILRDWCVGASIATGAMSTLGVILSAIAYDD